MASIWSLTSSPVVSMASNLKVGISPPYPVNPVACGLNGFEALNRTRRRVISTFVFQNRFAHDFFDRGGAGVESGQPCLAQGEHAALADVGPQGIGGSAAADQVVKLVVHQDQVEHS